MRFCRCFPVVGLSQAVEAVCPPGGYEILETLARLLDKNLIRTGDDGRFSMLHVVRQYMLERLDARDDAAECRARFQSWGLAAARALHERSSTMTHDLGIVEDFDLEAANLTACLEHAEMDGDMEAFALLITHMGVLFYLSGRLAQAERWITGALEKSLSPALRAGLLHNWGGYLLVTEGKAVDAEVALREALQLYRNGHQTVGVPGAVTDSRQCASLSRASQRGTSGAQGLSNGRGCGGVE